MKLHGARHIYQPLRDGRLSWRSWLTHGRQFTQQSAHLSTLDRAQGRESPPAKDRHPLSYAVYVT